MPVTDKREITFNSDALVYCLGVSPRAAEGFGLPAMPPHKVRFYPEENMVDVIYGKKDAMGAARIAANALGAVLISYCIRCKIPIPRIAEKRVRVEAEAIVLEFVTVFDRPPAPETADASSRTAQAVKTWKWVEPEKATLRRP